MTLTLRIIDVCMNKDVQAIYVSRAAYGQLVEESYMIQGMSDDKIFGLDVFVCGSSSHPYCVLYTAHGVQTILGENL